MEKKAREVENLSSLSEALVVCIRIMERDKTGKGPENPETLKRLLEDHRMSMLSVIGLMKRSPKMKTVHDEVIRLEELVEKFDMCSLEEAKRMATRML